VSRFPSIFGGSIMTTHHHHQHQPRTMQSCAPRAAATRVLGEMQSMDEFGTPPVAGIIVLLYHHHQQRAWHTNAPLCSLSVPSLTVPPSFIPFFIVLHAPPPSAIPSVPP
jgi:hypothetical protein